MATYGYTFQSGDGVTPTRLNDARTVSAIQTADISDAQITAAKLASNAVELGKLAAAVANALVPVGSVYAFARDTAPTGWLAANGGTFGSASSGATSASSDYESLFTLLWANGWTDANLPILNSAGAASTRGASAAADWSANKRLTLPDLRGIFARGSGSQTISGTTYSATFADKQTDLFKAHTHSTGQGLLLSAAGTITFAVGPYNAQAVTNSTGGSETRPANIALLYCIKH